MSLLNFDVLVHPKDNNDVILEPTIAPEGGNIAGSEGAIHIYERGLGKELVSFRQSFEMRFCSIEREC